MEFTRWTVHGTASSERGERAAEGDNVLCCPRINGEGSDATTSASPRKSAAANETQRENRQTKPLCVPKKNHNMELDTTQQEHT
uniref:Uncharacterized protein n=1 Tax=Nothobranchius kadleci TaxID=1051664 RepID=A0A1A8BQ55_NOTKA